MSTQNQDSVPFTIAHEQQSFRLLELPDELLHWLLASHDPPVLAIKSSEPPQSAADSRAAKSAYAVLCTPSSTYQLRQVQTSNSVFITQPVPSDPQSDGSSTSGLCAIASCNTTLELHHIPSAALAHLKEALPVWHAQLDNTEPSHTSKPKSEIFATIPFSDGECQTAWSQLAAFEYEGDCFRPSALTSLHLWRAILSLSLAESIDLSSMFQIRSLRAAVEDEGYPSALLDAVITRLLPGWEGVPPDDWARVDKDKCVRWTGTTILEAKGEAGMATAEFLAEWKDALPEVWRGEARLENLGDGYVQPDKSTIAVKPDVGGGDAQGGAAGSGGKRAAGARKWHEKFKRARN